MHLKTAVSKLYADQLEAAFELLPIHWKTSI